jgi:hypothetical protein
VRISFSRILLDEIRQQHVLEDLLFSLLNANQIFKFTKIVVPNINIIRGLITELIKKLHDLSPRANYTDRATAACRRSNCQLLRIKGATWSA